MMLMLKVIDDDNVCFHLTSLLSAYSNIFATYIAMHWDISLLQSLGTQSKSVEMYAPCPLFSRQSKNPANAHVSAYLLVSLSLALLPILSLWKSDNQGPAFGESVSKITLQPPLTVLPSFALFCFVPEIVLLYFLHSLAHIYSYSCCVLASEFNSFAVLSAC